MPKAPFKIDQFQGGLNNHFDAKDIPVEYSSALVNFIGDRVGRLRVVGRPEEHDHSFTTASYSLALQSDNLSAQAFSFSQGQIVYVFKTDRIFSTSTAAETGDTWYVMVNTDGFMVFTSDTRISATSQPWHEAHPEYQTAWGGIVGRLISNPTTHSSWDGSHSFYSSDGQLRIINTDYVNVGNFVGDNVLSNTHWVTGACDETISGHDDETLCTTTLQGGHLLYSVGASALWMGYIKKAYVTNTVAVDEWAIYPQAIQTPLTTIESGTLGSVVPGQGPGAYDTAPGAGQIKLETAYDTEGDGSLLLEGRQFYVTYTYDGVQESLPSTPIEQMGSLPVVSSTTTSDVDYDAVSIPLASHLGFDLDGGQVEIEDDDNYTQVLDYTSAGGNLLSGVTGWYGDGGREKTYASTSQAVDTVNEDWTRITTTIAHEIQIGDTVIITGTGTGTYNGQHTVVNVDGTTHFDIAVVFVGIETISVVLGEDKHNIVSGTTVKLVRNDGDLSVKLTLHILMHTNTTDYFDPRIGGNRITHINIYTNRFDSTFTRIKEEDFAHVATFDMVSGYTKPNNVIEPWVAGVTGYKCPTVTFSTPFATSYQMRTGVDPKARSIEARMKTAVIANRRCYAGNVRMQDENGTVRTYADRMLKSPPNAFDVFPTGEYIDVAINDGEDIVKLEEFNSKILQFKENTLYVISIAQDYEFLEQSYRFRGIDQECSAYKTDMGIAFCNEYGAYFYGGEGVQSLTSQKVGNWNTLYAVGTTVGFDPKKSQLHFVFPQSKATSTGISSMIYDMPTKGWTQTGAVRYNIDTTTARTAFFEYNRTLMFGNLKDADPIYVKFYEWKDVSANAATSTSTYKTKNMDMASTNVDKRFYHARLTYKSTGASGVKAKIWVDDIEFDLYESAELPTTSGVWTTIKLYVGTEASYTIKEGKVLQLELYDGTAPNVTFEVNDIVFISRTKQVLK